MVPGWEVTMDVGKTHEAYARPFTSDEAAEWLSISKRQLLELTRCGIIPAVKVGQRWRYSQRKLAEFVGIVEPNADPA